MREFRLYWHFLSRRAEKGRPKLTPEVRKLIRRMAVENPTCGAPRIHGELLKLGFEAFARTVSRYLARVGPRGEPGKQWLSFLENHRAVIAAIDFFTVPTVTFRLLYCVFVISHNRKRILYLKVTEHPSSLWVVQQLREAFPDESAHRYLILDRDAKLSKGVIDAIKTMGMKPIRTAHQSPWQNGVAEPWVGSCRRDLLDHVIVVNEVHLRRLGRNYLDYYHQDRTDNGLDKETPAGRLVERRRTDKSMVLALPRAGGCTTDIPGKRLLEDRE